MCGGEQEGEQATPCGCEYNYKTLCDAINQTIKNINTIKNTIEEIGEFKSYE
jgi:hypothetical protein